MTLEDMIRTIVRDELATLGASTSYTSTGPLPPGITSREHFAAECRRLRIGRKDGRAWTVYASTWHEARAAKRPALRVVQTETERADAYLDAARARATGGRR